MPERPQHSGCKGNPKEGPGAPPEGMEKSIPVVSMAPGWSRVHAVRLFQNSDPKRAFF